MEYALAILLNLLCLAAATPSCPDQATSSMIHWLVAAGYMTSASVQSPALRLVHDLFDFAM